MITLINTDLCSVCGTFQSREGKAYCSDHCRKIAHRFRKRLMYERRFLADLGFTFEYENGVQLITGIPESIRYAYPENCIKFTFPNFPASESDLLLLNAANYWSVLSEHLGDFLGSFLRWLYDHQIEDHDLQIQLMDSAVKTCLYDPHQHFKCDRCGEKFVKSVMSQGGFRLCSGHQGVNPF